MTIGSEHRPNKQITSTLQKQINKKILKEQSEPQTYTLNVKKHYVLVHESHLVQRNTEKIMYICMTIHGKAPTSSLISTENDGSPRLFLKYNYRTEFPCKNNHNTDPCLPANDQKMVCHTLLFIQQIIFSTQHDFKTCFDTKNAYLQLRLQ